MNTHYFLCGKQYKKDQPRIYKIFHNGICVYLYTFEKKIVWKPNEIKKSNTFTFLHHIH